MKTISCDLHTHLYSLSITGAFLLSAGGNSHVLRELSFPGGIPVHFIFRIGSQEKIKRNCCEWSLYFSWLHLNYTQVCLPVFYGPFTTPAIYFILLIGFITRSHTLTSGSKQVTTHYKQQSVNMYSFFLFVILCVCVGGVFVYVPPPNIHMCI